jgi:hypothetical protein
VAGVGGQAGAILFDPALDIGEVEADLTIGITAIGYTFGLAGRQARVLGVFPMAWGGVDGWGGATPQHQSLNGLVDPRIKLSVALRGAPALTRSGFARAPRQTIVGVSATVMPPLGAYHEDRLINLGFNRWAIKPEIGVARTLAKWTVEGSAGVWLYTINGRYFPGAARKEQDPVGSFQGHVSYALPRRSWVAFDATWFAGGASRVNGVDSPDRQRNSRLGGTAVDHDVQQSIAQGVVQHRRDDTPRHRLRHAERYLAARGLLIRCCKVAAWGVTPSVARPSAPPRARAWSAPRTRAGTRRTSRRHSRPASQSPRG